MLTQLYVHKPLYVEALEVTAENLIEIAKWTGGEIHLHTPKNGGEGTNYVKVPVKNPLNERQTQAFPGDYVLKVGGSFKVFTAKAFFKSFNSVAEEPCGRTDGTLDNAPCVLGKSHRLGERPVACRSLQDYLLAPVTVDA